MISTGLTGGRQLSSGLRNECNHVVEDTIPHVPAAVRLFWGSGQASIHASTVDNVNTITKSRAPPCAFIVAYIGLRYFIETHW